MGDKGINRVGGTMEGREWEGGCNLRSTLTGRDRIKRENRSNGRQDRMEGNIVSLYNTTIMEVICETTQIWPILNCLPSKGRGWGGREEKKLKLKVLGKTVEYCSCH